jgi:integrase
MPRSVKLSWQPGAADSTRMGRWRKKYKGKVYYFPGGRGKSDRDAYDAAIAAWEQLKGKIDITTPRRHQRAYEAAIDQWEQVLAWSNKYGDREHADQAVEKLTSLRRRFMATKLSPLTRSDSFESNFDPVVDPKLLQEMVLSHQAKGEPLEGPPLLLKPSQKIIDAMDGSPSRIAREIWRDRLAVQDRKAASPDESLGSYTKIFLKVKENEAKANQVSVGRVYALRLHLDHFRDWLGKDTAVKDIDGGVLARYHAHLLEKIASGKWTPTTAGHYMTTVKEFVRWLSATDAIPKLPRIMAEKSKLLAITKPATKIVVFTKEEVASLLTEASDRTKLYILLMLNCGMTQKDVSDLLVSEVDWDDGRIIRKRSKTSGEENVPVVNYKLWRETFRLLEQERAADSKERVLLNSNGSPIWSEEITNDGKYQKTDNIKNAFDRLRKETKIAKPLKSLKKTSASLLRDNEKFSNLEGLFLGHAPQSMSDKHYAKLPQTLLDQAVQWLENEYGLTAPPK